MLRSQVTLSGRLRSTSSSFLELSSASGELLALTFDRLGSTMLLLKTTLDIDSHCQDFPPSLPVLPPPLATVVRSQAWYPLEGYAFCGAFQFEKSGGQGFYAMALDASLRYVPVSLPAPRRVDGREEGMCWVRGAETEMESAEGTEGKPQRHGLSTGTVS